MANCLAEWSFLEHLLENTTIFLASSGYLELEMFDDAALVLEEIAPDGQRGSGRTCEHLLTAKKWDMAAAVASHLIKVDPETAGCRKNIPIASASRTAVVVHAVLTVLLAHEWFGPRPSLRL